MSKKTVAVGLALMLVVAGCGYRARSAGAADPLPASSTATSSATSSSAGSQTQTSAPRSPVAAPILPTTVTSSRPPAPSGHPVTAAQLLSAPVPSLCKHSPGRLVNGKLPGIPAGQGSVELASHDGYRTNDTLAAFGDLDADGVGDAAVVMDCDRGGVSWPDEIVFYGPGPKVLGSFDLGATLDGTRDGTRRISYSAGKVIIDSAETLPYEPQCCASGQAFVTLRWDGSKIVLAGVQHLPGPTSITTRGIGAVQLGMSAQQLTSLGYRGSNGVAGCMNYYASGKPSVTYDPSHRQVVAITGIQDSKTYLGGFGVGDRISLVQLKAAFPRYRVATYFKRDFGQGGTGLTVIDSAGSIGFALAAAPDATGEVTIIGVKVGGGLQATAMEVAC